jgi:Protein of unknown function (DUF3499)
MSRLCDRPICGEPAGVTLTYSYDDGTVWLDHLAADDHPMSYDLCDRHAGGLRVPRGWRLADRRSDPSGVERAGPVEMAPAG